MSSTKIEFAVQMSCISCVDAVKKCLENIPGVRNIDVSLEKNSVVVDSNLSTLDIQRKIESTGRKVVVKGYEGTFAGVSILDTGEKDVKGVIRFIQVTPKSCIIDGTVDGLVPGTHQISIHECGDLSQGCNNVGDFYNPTASNSCDEIYGNLGVVAAKENGRASFRIENNVINLADVIGRSFVITDKTQNIGKKIACGIIARSAGLFQNPKTICACDGVSIWDEDSKLKSTL